MSEPRKNEKKNPEHTSVDWAEKLKESMNEDYQDAKTDVASHEDDDLAALLRAQLGKTSEQPSTFTMLDTSDFEDEFDESFEEDLNEIIDEDLDEPIDEDFDEPIDEDFDEPIDEDFDEPIDEDIDEPIDEDIDEPIDEDFDEPIDEDLDEPIEEEPDRNFEAIADGDAELYAEEDTENLFGQDSNESESDEFEPFSEEMFEDGLEEDVDDIQNDVLDNDLEYGDAKEDEEESPLPWTESSLSHSTIVYRKPLNKGLTDDCLNGLAPNETVGGHRLKELDEENTRLLEEVRFLNNREISEEKAWLAISTEKRRDPDARADDRRTDSVEDINDGYSVQMHDPLQLGLDDISPTAQMQNTIKKKADTVSDERKSNYAAQMATDDGGADNVGDTDLCMRLGYEDSLRRAEDQPIVEEIRTKTHENYSLHISVDRPSATHGQEYRGRVDTDHVEASYIRAYRKNLTRVCIAGLGALVAILYDFLPTVLQSSQNGSNSFILSATYPLVSVLWMVLVSLPFLRRMARGIRSLWNFEPTRYAVSAVALLISILYGVIACIVYSQVPLPLFSGPALLMLAIAAISDFRITEGEHKAFTVVSSGKPAHVLTSELTSASAALQAEERDGKTGRMPPMTEGRRIMTVVRTGRIADYFARTERYNPYMGRLNYMLPAALLLAIVNAGVAVALGGEPVSLGLPVFTATYLCALPAAYLLALTLPLSRVNRMLTQKGAAVVGSAAPVEYAGMPLASLIFSDGDALKSLYRKDITLRDDTDSEEYRRKADVVFRLLDTPLGVEPSLRNSEIDGYRIEIAETDEQYIRLYLTDILSHGITEIMMGSHEALTRRGVRLPKISMEARYKKSENSHVIYLAFNRCFHLAYAAEYRVGRTFAKVSAALTELGHEVSLTSYDPMVSPDMEGIALLRKRNRVKLIRPSAYEPIYKTRSSGLIATGRSLDILRPLIACHKMKCAYRRGHAAAWALLTTGAALSIFAVCVGGGALLTSAAVVAWQIISAIVVAATTLSAVGKKAFSQSNDKLGKPTADTSGISADDQTTSPRIRKR